MIAFDPLRVSSAPTQGPPDGATSLGEGGRVCRVGGRRGGVLTEKSQRMKEIS